MQLAQECMEQDSLSTVDTAQPLEGIEKFAQMIDSSKWTAFNESNGLLQFNFFTVLCRVKVKFVNTVIEIEHVPKDSATGVAVQINIEK